MRNTGPAAAARWYLRVVCYLTPSSCVPRGCRSKGSRGMRVTRGAVAARRGAAGATGRREGEPGGRGDRGGKDGMTARRGAARRGEARRGERRPRATSAMREARRGTKGEEEVGRLLRYGSSRVVRGGGSGRKGRGIPPLPSPPPTDHLYTLPTYLPYPTLPIYPRRPLSSRLLRYVPTKKNVLLCNVARRCEIRGKRKTT